MKVTVGIVLAPQYGDMARLKEAWIEADAMGADRIFTADHFHAQRIDNLEDGNEDSGANPKAKNFEGGTIQAAMAVTTKRAEIGCLVHANSYRNPNLLADMARTIDHLSGGRFILGIGAGFLKPDYDAYGYEYGTKMSRALDLQRNLPIIRARFDRLNPRPLRRIPLLIPGHGEKVALRLVAEHADIWHVYGPLDLIQHKAAVLDDWCKKVGRDPSEIERSTMYVPDLLPDDDPDRCVSLGFTDIIAASFGPDWDLTLLKDLIAWRDERNRAGAHYVSRKPAELFSSVRKKSSYLSS